MRFFCEKLDKLRFGWNKRPLDEHDFHLLCRRFKIRVDEMPLAVKGFYYRVKGVDSIVISSRLKGPERLAVMFHELGHFLFHAPDSGATANFHGVGHPTRKECEADVFALCAIIPREMLIEHSQEALTELGYSEEFLAQRIAIFTRHNL